MSLYSMQKFLFHLNREPEVQQHYRAGGDTRTQLLNGYALSAEEQAAVALGDVGKMYVLGCNGQLLMHFAALLGLAWPDYLESMRQGVRTHGPVRAGIYAMTTQHHEKVAGV